MKAGHMRLFGGASMIAAVVSIFAASAEASPVTLPDAQYYNAAAWTEPNQPQSFTGGNTSTPVNVSGSSDLYTPTTWGFTTSNDYNVPSVSATAQAGPGVPGTVSSQLTYYVSFVGTPGNVSVRTQASGGTSAEGPNIINDFGHNEAVAGFWIDEYFPANGGTGDELINVSVESNQRGGSGPGIHSFAVDQQITFIANAVYQVVMQTIATAYDGHTASAYVDPTFTAPAGYTVVTSAGIGNGAPVAATPIPAALPLFTAALAGFGLLGWRRKNAA